MHDVYAPQLHCGPLDLSRMEPVRNNPRFGVKPIGGLWTSTFTPYEKWCSAWVEWCVSEMPEWLTTECYVLYPRTDARIYIIDSYSDLERLVKDYGAVILAGRPYPDWENIAKYYDAVRLTEKGQAETRFSYPLCLYGWDVESTLWFRNVFRDVKHISEVPHTCKLVKV